MTFDGTRGDAQPTMIAAQALMTNGFEVMVSGPGENAAMASEFKVPFTRSRLSVQKVLCDEEVTELFTSGNAPAAMAAQDRVKARFETDDTRAKDVANLYQLCQDWKPDLIIAAMIVLPVSLMMGNIFKIPVVSITLQFMRPYSCLPPLMPLTLPKFMYKPAWNLFIFLLRRQQIREVAPYLSKLSGIPASKLAITSAELMRIYSAKASFLSIISASPAIHGGPPEDFNCNNVQIGALMPSDQQLDISSFGSEGKAVLQKFLEAGSAPIYMGFGSIICGTSKFMTLLCLRALKLTGERGILLRGWSKMSLDDLEGEPDEADLRAYCAAKVLFVDTAPHRWLFPQCQVIVHHGGAGTLNASALSGRPTLIAPIFCDQPAHSELLNQRGFGVGLFSMATTKPRELAEAIEKCINSPDIQQKAKEVAQELAKEDGAGRLVEVIKDYMESHVKTGRHMAMKKALDEKLGDAE